MNVEFYAVLPKSIRNIPKIWVIVFAKSKKQTYKQLLNFLKNFFVNIVKNIPSSC